MGLTVDDVTADAERPRSRLRSRLIAVMAVLLPIVVLVGAAAWFIRSYILPPTVSIAEPSLILPAEASPAPAQPRPAAPMETTGSGRSPPTRSSAAPNWPPAVRPAQATLTSIWDAVPLPGPSRQVQQFAPESQPSLEPAAVAVPLPPPRPQISAANINVGDPVPLPRPRTRASN